MSVTHLPAWAMVNDRGDLFYPDNPEDARHFRVAHGARPVLPWRFPWPDELVDPATVEFCGP